MKAKISPFILMVTLLASTAWAESDKVLMESDGIRVTSQDVTAELRYQPAEVRTSVFFRKENLMNLVTNLFARRVLARQALSNEVALSSVERTQLQLAQDKAISDVYLKWLDQRNIPTLSILDQRARELYRTEDKRFNEQASVRVSHILVTKGEDAKEKASALMQKLRDGAEFATLAKEHSTDPGSAAKGGDLGFFERGRMVKPFEDAAFSAEVDSLVGPVETQFGQHIIKVTAKKIGGRTPYDDVKEELYREITAKAQVDGRQRVLNDIMARSQLYMPAIDAYVADQKPKD